MAGTKVPFENDENVNSDTMTIFKAHPTEPGVMQKFEIKIKKGKTKKKAIKEGILLGNFRKAKDGEKGDCQIYSPNDFALMPYVEIKE